MTSNILSISIIPTRRKACRTFLLSLLLLFSNLAHANLWKAYLSYYEPTEIEQAGSNMLYVLASGALYSYNRNDQSLQTYDKTTVLSDCDIAHIAWCQAARRLVIVYSNGNIDLLDQNSNVTNMANYMNKSMTEDKTVYSIDIAGSYAYLSTGFGIMKVNVSGAEFSDTYQLGFKVDYSYLDGSYLYAASSTQGLYRALLTSNLSDKASWTRVGDYIARPKTMDADLLALVKTLNPGGPKYNYFGFLRFTNNRLYTCGGSGYTIPATPQVYDGSQWTIYDESFVASLGHIFAGSFSIDVDPKDPNHVAVGGQTGLYEFQNGTLLKAWSNDNSPLQTAKPVGNNNKDYVLVTTLKYDADGNLWMSNSQAPERSLLKLSADQWTGFDHTELMSPDGYSLEVMRSMIVDSRKLLWLVNDYYRMPSLICYQPSTDGIKRYSTFTNDDGTTYTLSNVRFVTEDKNNNIWVGTNIGPFYLTPADISSGSDIFTQVKVPRNDGTNYADYLLSGVDVSCMAVDRANRKWFGTNGSGVYCISSDNIQQVNHFTADNSALLSNDIYSIAIDDATGIIYIGTAKGLCSYQSDANTASDVMTKESVWAYPNPVKPDYTGAITITGLQNNADVKIVTSNGTLVHQGRASGNTYKWYGLDQSGKRVASGVYMVEIATAEGEKGVVCKIAIVR